MVRIGPLQLNETWKYALVGGTSSIPLTAGLYWSSGMGHELALDGVFLGGVLAGYLAAAASADTASVGLRAGVVGGLPGLWLLYDVLWAENALSGPLWFRIAALSMVVIGLTSAVLGFAGFVGLLGSKVGVWLARNDGEERSPLAGN